MTDITVRLYFVVPPLVFLLAPCLSKRLQFCRPRQRKSAPWTASCAMPLARSLSGSLAESDTDGRDSFTIRPSARSTIGAIFVAILAAAPPLAAATVAPPSLTHLPLHDHWRHRLCLPLESAGRTGVRGINPSGVALSAYDQSLSMNQCIDTAISFDAVWEIICRIY